MKKILIITAAYFLINNVYCQNNITRDSIILAQESTRVKYFKDSSVQTIINVSKIEGFKKWAESADTTEIIENNIKWDIASLKNTLEKYRNTTYDFKDIITKCRLVSESLKMKNANMQVANVIEP